MAIDSENFSMPTGILELVQSNSFILEKNNPETREEKLVTLILVLTMRHALSIEIHLILTNSFWKIIAISLTLQMSKLRLK